MNKFIIAVRSVTRKLGINRFVSSILPSKDYEERFATGLLNAIRKGDVVWDVGANVGVYTVQFADQVGPHGRVYAFEPVPMCRDQIVATCSAGELENVEVVAAALSETSKTSFMQLEDDDLGVTHQLSDSTEQHPRQIEVQVYSGDDVISLGVATVPNVIKMDVEGFELDCLKGMKQLLQNESLRAVFVEVHFSELEKRGSRFGPSEIEDLLRSTNFTTVNWLDSSHIGASR